MNLTAIFGIGAKRENMKPQELYDMKHEKNGTLDMFIGCYFNHIFESGIEQWDLNGIESDRVEIKIIKEFHFDSRRFWRLATVWFDGYPVMITRNSGREGDDFSDRFITDKAQFTKMCIHIHSLASKFPDEIADIVEVDVDIPGLTEFYGNRLDGYFERY